MVRPYGMDAAEGEHGREHAQVFPVQLLLLPRLEESLDKTVRDVLACVHADLHSHNHSAVDLYDAIMEPTAT
jgi:hypothetical protein